MHDMYQEVTDRIVAALEEGIVHGSSRGASLPQTVMQ